MRERGEEEVFAVYKLKVSNTFQSSVISHAFYFCLMVGLCCISHDADELINFVKSSCFCVSRPFP